MPKKTVRKKRRVWVYLTLNGYFKFTLNYPLRIDDEDMNTAFEPYQVELKEWLPTPARRKRA